MTIIIIIIIIIYLIIITIIVIHTMFTENVFQNCLTNENLIS